MIKIKQRVPNYVSGVDPRIEEVVTVYDLLKIDWVARYVNYAKGDKQCFAFSESLHGLTPRMLMSLSGYSEETGKYHYWQCIGFIETDDEDAVFGCLPSYEELTGKFIG